MGSIIKSSCSSAWSALCSWENLLLAANKAARGKRGKYSVAKFERNLAENLLSLQARLRSFDWSPRGYTHFYIHEPKRRKISAAPFADRVVHHALINIIELQFESLFSNNSFANRKGRGNHRAIDRLQTLARRHRYVMRLDVVQHFPSIDHAVLLKILRRRVPESELLWLIQQIMNNAVDVTDHAQHGFLFANDDLLALCRDTGLPIGNLTSQFWSNCYLHALDQFIERELSCKAYVCYVDDMALFSDSKTELWQWKREIIVRLEQLRLRIHRHSAQVNTTAAGIPWLGFVIYPAMRKLKARKQVFATRRLRKAYKACLSGIRPWRSLTLKVGAWLAHAHYATGIAFKKTVLQRMTKVKV